MNERHKKIISELTNLLYPETLIFLANNLGKEENTEENIDYILSILLSSYVSALFNLMQWVSEDHSTINENVKKFIKELLEYLNQNDILHTIEIVKNES